MFKDNGLHETRYCENCLELQKKLQSKEQECEELKKQVNRCNEGWGKAEAEKDWYQQAEQAKQEESYYLQMRLYNYKQSLDEIEKIAKKDCKKCCEGTAEDNIKNSWSIYEIKDIIDKAKDSE